MKKVLILSIIVGVICFVASCTPTSDALKKKYEDNGFEIQDYTASEFGYESEEIAYAFKVTKGDDSEATIISFADGNVASKFYNEQNASKNDEESAFKIGNTVIVGTKEAVKLAKDK